jgi:hypothetical protein
MFPAIVACLMILTGAVIYQARDAFIFGSRRAFWWRAALALPLAGISGVGLWLLIAVPELSQSVFANPLGLSWDCETYGRGGALVCFKH